MISMTGETQQTIIDWPMIEFLNNWQYYSDVIEQENFKAQQKANAGK